jgi:GR25 family glycosyltransferase involved in LPS biosynthesis
MDDIKHSFYINLDERTDRKEHVEKQLESIGIVPNRFNALLLGNGAIGCSMSHMRCLQVAKEKRWDHVLICEDDIDFMNPTLFKKNLNLFLANHNDWDVVLLAGNNIPPYIQTAEYCVQVSKCLTTTGYLVKSHYYDTLIHNIREGVEKLIQYPKQGLVYSIDNYWFHLQVKDKWFLIVPLTVKQKGDYSNIEKKNTNYSHLLLDLDKKELIENQRKKKSGSKTLFN